MTKKKTEVIFDIVRTILAVLLIVLVLTNTGPQWLIVLLVILVSISLIWRIVDWVRHGD